MTPAHLITAAIDAAHAPIHADTSAIPGSPVEARWTRAQPRRTLAAPLLDHIVQSAFPGRRAVHALPLGDGLRNSNFKLQLSPASDPVALRIYEHDASLCQKEMDLMRLLGRSVPLPEVIHAEPHASEDLPPFALLRWIEGITFRDLKRTGDTAAIAQAAYAAGETLAAIGRFTFPQSGWIGPGPAVTAPLLEGENPIPRFIDLCLASGNLKMRMPSEMRDRVHLLVWSMSPGLAALGGASRLVHGDFNRRNLLVRCVSGLWSVAAVVDWEFAVSGSPLADVGNFLCYENSAQPLAEPHFSLGFIHAGGQLPPDWKHLARVVDLLGICASLSHDFLPPEFVPELLELVRATVIAVP